MDVVLIIAVLAVLCVALVLTNIYWYAQYARMKQRLTRLPDTKRG